MAFIEADQPIADQHCDTCRYFFSDGSESNGICRRMPPVPVDTPVMVNTPDMANFYKNQVVTVWPEVKADDWCGEYKNKGS